MVVVGLQGVQGSGKSRLGTELGSEWEAISVDDFYLPCLSVTRGPPGTHDVEWLERTLVRWKEGERDVEVPTFDKTLREGRGDRSGTRKLNRDARHLLLEGWCVGFEPLSSTDYAFRPYSERVWGRLDLLLVLHPPSLEVVHEWRWESEEKMGKEEVRAFVEEYMPYYRTYLPSLHSKEGAHHIFLDEERSPFLDRTRKHGVHLPTHVRDVVGLLPHVGHLAMAQGS